MRKNTRNLKHWINRKAKIALQFKATSMTLHCRGFGSQV